MIIISAKKICFYTSTLFLGIFRPCHFFLRVLPPPSIFSLPSNSVISFSFRLYAFDDSTCNPLIVLCRKTTSLWFIVRIVNVSNIASSFLILPWSPLYFASVKSFCNFCSLASCCLILPHFAKSICLQQH